MIAATQDVPVRQKSMASQDLCVELPRTSMVE